MLRKLLKQKRYFKNLYKSQKGITGLETAIILIAFVVVAAVFAYTVLSAGLFSTQKSQEAVYSGLERTQATMELKSSLVAKVDAAEPTKVGQLVFTLAIATGGESIDFTPPTDANNDGLADTGSNNYVTISYIDKYQRIDNLAWTKSAVGQANSNNLLETGEQFEITVGTATANLVDALTTDLVANNTFTIEIKTAKGAVLSFERTLGGYLNTINDLH
jgi:archaeal flagellin FlaB